MPRGAFLFLSGSHGVLAAAVAKSNDLSAAIYSQNFTERATPTGLSDTCDSNGYCWPEIYLIGTGKAATTSIFDHMTQSNEVCGGVNPKDPLLTHSGHSNKELHFFDADGGGYSIDDVFDGRSWEKENLKKTDYTMAFTRADCPISPLRFMDASPGYICHGKAAHRLYDFVPSNIRIRVKLIVIFRDPLGKDVSWYNNQRHDLEVDGIAYNDPFVVGKPSPSYGEYFATIVKPWHACVEQVGGDETQTLRQAAYDCVQNNASVGGKHEAWGMTVGMYAPQYRSWTQDWPRHQLLMLRYESLIAFTKVYMTHLYSFLGIGASHAPSVLPEDNANDFANKVTEIKCSVRDAYQKIIAPWNKRLYTMIKEDVAAGKISEHEPAFEEWPTEGTVKCVDD